MAVDKEINMQANTQLRPLSARNSNSEPDLATALKLHPKSGFPPGTTVDELWLYRRKRPPENLWPQDNIKLREGSFSLLKSEYCRRFKNFYNFGSCGELALKQEDLSPVRAKKPDDSLKVEGALELQPEYNERFIEYPVERPFKVKPLGDSFHVVETDDEMEDEQGPGKRLLTEIISNYVKYPTIERPHLIKRPTNLRLEGDWYLTTENSEKFIEYPLTERPYLTRKPTTLRLEGDMDIKTETREKFVPFEYHPRPPLCKKFTNLHLEGDLDIHTEQRDQFIPYKVQRRPPLLKKLTNLHVEGDLDLLPLYRKEFVAYKTERPKLALPMNNLKTDGFYDNVSDVSKPFEQQIHPQIPFLRTDHPMETVTESRRQFVEKAFAKTEKSAIHNNLHLEGRIDMNPEYRNAYIDYNKDGRVSPAPRRSRRRTQSDSLRNEGKMDVSPEYSCSYVDFPRERPKLRRPQGNLSSEGEIDHLTEKSEKYVPYPNASRSDLVKREPELRLEGRFECQPEYRKAYINYLTRERVERKPRPLDHLGSEQKRAIETDPTEKTALPIPQIYPSTSDSPEIETNKENTDHPRLKSSSSSASDGRKTPGPISAKRRDSKSKSPSKRSLSQIESSVFGPKLTVPKIEKTPPTRSSSPTTSVKRKSSTLPRTRTRSPRPEIATSTDSDISSNRNRRFGNPVRVENLALRHSMPLPPMPDTSARNKWMRDSSIDSTSSAFVVLDKEINNNNDSYVQGDKRRASNYRESRWMPSWSSQPF